MEMQEEECSTCQGYGRVVEKAGEINFFPYEDPDGIHSKVCPTCRGKVNHWRNTNLRVAKRKEWVTT